MKFLSLRENNQVVEAILARATDADNLTQPTQVPFVQGQPIPFEETLFYEFKEVKGESPVRSKCTIPDEVLECNRLLAWLKKRGSTRLPKECVELDVASCGKTKKKAIEGLKNAIEAYIEYMILPEA